MSADDADTAARNAAARLREVGARRSLPGHPAPGTAELISEAHAWATLAVYEYLAHGAVTVTAYTVQP